MRDIQRLLQILLCLITFGQLPNLLLAEDGLFADFTTSKGAFSCKLFYDQAPQTVANFVSLATGERSWVDAAKAGVSHAPFYDGLIFHRVISGFVIQTGSPKGDGTDGPGYSFPDEIVSSLSHDHAGVLSMANSGPDSNGSQFFITLANQASLDGSYSIFGEVVSGLDVVQSIGSVATDSNDKPVDPVVLEHVSIRRVGTAAEAFDVNAQHLPVVSLAKASLRISGQSYYLDWPSLAGHQFQLFDTADLKSWTPVWSYYNVIDQPLSLDVTSTTTNQDKFFYSVIDVDYLAPAVPPATLNGRSLTLNTEGGTQFVTTLNAAGTSGSSTWVNYNDTGYLTSLTWRNYPLYTYYVSNSSNGLYFQLKLKFETTTTGTYSGTLQYDSSTYNMEGTFSLSSP